MGHVESSTRQARVLNLPSADRPMGCLMLAHFDVRAAATLCLKLREKRTQRGRRVSVAIDPNGRLSLLAKVPLIASRSAAKGPTTPSDGTIRQINPTDASITLMDDVVSVTPSRRRPAREIESAYSRWVRSRPGSERHIQIRE